MFDRARLANLSLDTLSKVYYAPMRDADGLHGAAFKCAELRDLPKTYDEISGTEVQIMRWLWIEDIGIIEGNADVADALRIVSARVENTDHRHARP